MAQFMLVLMSAPKDDASYSPEEMQQVVSEYGAWARGLDEAGKLVGGEKLCDEGGRALQAEGGSITVTDGPYAETKEVIGGYFIVKADSYDDAVDLARTCPHMKYGSSAIVRQIEEFGSSA